MFDFWAYPVVHLLLLKSPIAVPSRYKAKFWYGGIFSQQEICVDTFKMTSDEGMDRVNVA